MKQKLKYTLGVSLCIVFLPISYISASTQDDPLNDLKGYEERLKSEPQIILKENDVREITIPGSAYSAGYNNGQKYIVKTCIVAESSLHLHFPRVLA